MKQFAKNLAIAVSLLTYLTLLGGSWLLTLLYHWQFGIATFVLAVVGMAAWVTLRQREEGEP